MAVTLTPSGFPLDLSAARDLALSPEGDLIVGPSGDFLLVEGVEALVQEVLFRLKTRQGDWSAYPDCGSSLDTLIGQPLSATTGRRAEALVIRALTHDGLFSEDAVSVEASPTADGLALTLLITCALDAFSNAPDGEEDLLLQVTLDLQEGLLIA